MCVRVCVCVYVCGSKIKSNSIPNKKCFIYRVSHFKWAPRITSKEVIFKENDSDKSCCTQKETSNGDLEIILNNLPQGQSIFLNGMT